MPTSEPPKAAPSSNPRGPIRAELDKLKQMSFQDKLWYIWEYYKYHILILAFVLVMGGSILSSLFDPQTTYLHYVLVNLNTQTQSELPSLTTDFHDAMQLEEDQQVSFENLYLSGDSSALVDDMRTLEILYARVAAQQIDILLLPQTACDNKSLTQFFANLQEVLPPELWDKVCQDAIYLPHPDTGEPYPACLKVSQYDVIAACGFTTDSVVLGVVSNSEHLEQVIALLNYIYAAAES